MKRTERATKFQRSGALEYSTDMDRWRALASRDKNADGSFFYSVKSTGIYCRPSCPSRFPKKENVAFHASCHEAEAAGFRPCKRCQPGGSTLGAEHAAVVARACKLLESTDRKLRLPEIARQVGMSPYHLHRVFKKLTGLTPKAFADARRAESLRRVMPRAGSVTRAIYDSGFGSTSRFYAKASRMLGMKPASFHDGGNGSTIRYAVDQCSLGIVLVASSEKGVCWISLGNDPVKLIHELQDSFPKAKCAEGGSDYNALVSRVLGMVDSGQFSKDLPLDLRGTAFQQRVWQKLQEIPIGTTWTYTQLAHELGMPMSVRAVARACAANKLAVAVPCHRIVRRDGSISGYRWGVKRKLRLLRTESKGRHSK